MPPSVFANAAQASRASRSDLHANALARCETERVDVRRSVKQLLAATLFASTVAAAGCTSGDQSVNLDDLRNAEAPYYYVGRSFEGDEASFISRYRDHQASILYGTCHAGDDGGCAPPLEIQHSLCLGVVTISIFGNRGKAQRAAEALRPLSQGARSRAKRPAIVFDRGVSC